MSVEAKRFRAAAAARRGWRYPERLRAAARRYALAAGGRSRCEIAAELGLRVETLSRWLATPPPGLGTVHEVVVSPAPASGLTLVGPSGWRVEGLSVGEVAELLRALG